MKKLKAGTALYSINPKKGAILGGYPHVVRKNIGVHDNLYTSVIYIDNGTSIVFISLDLVGFSKVYSDRIRNKIFKETGIDRNNISIMCTHTHSSPYCMPMLSASSPDVDVDEDYVEIVSQKIYLAVLEAMNNTFSASIGFGKGICGKEKGVGGNRKSSDEISDPEVCVLGIKDEKGVLRACMVNYALHPTFLHAENLLVSADYPGYIRKYLQKRSPETVFLFAQGASGDQSSRFFRKDQSFDEAKRIGYVLGEEIVKTLQNIRYQDSADISLKNIVLKNYTRIIPSVSDAEKKLINLQDEYEDLKKSNTVYTVLRSKECNIFGAERALEYAQLKSAGKKLPRIDEEHPLIISVVQINKSCLVLLPGEIFVRFGLDIKNNKRFQTTFVIELVNGGSAGYIYTKEVLEKFDGYEIQSSQYSWEMGEYLVKDVIELMK